MNESFGDLHHGVRPLVLPNAWDVPSALLLLAAGFPAVGTTSFGVAASAGRPDARRSTAAASLALARDLSRLPCHISVDIEDGYAESPDEVADYAAALPVAGVNIEDSTAERLVDPAAHAEKVAAVKERRPDLFVNARVDTFWLGQDAGTGATLRRALLYVEAGADGVFVPGTSDPDVLRELAAQLPVPLNVLVTPALGLTALTGLGVRRVSTGSLPYRAALHTAVETALAARDEGPLPAAVAYPDLQERLRRHGRT
ncbi:isocitrate lyase/phosphoenolpyruvate mutase family protein [Streptomyces sp. TS71-3]|uniref:isocitrate lyase/PEP mutase family protein n=1 Tax=Streptomyces sp. TS71-3 TaxID=2733862 RepID=UPI001B1D760C|nr:isocitrate lyase/phosphoenolpyruvate mutase family protein [Streptomyces sp. TS71-3]GHJ39685.1 hypothetical protein Sm713_52940 [Streptomyces sp. TS71-3]